MSKKTMAIVLVATVFLLSMAAFMLYSAGNSVIVRHKTVHDQCESISMTTSVRDYLINGTWQARDMNQYEIVCSYITYPQQVEGSDLRFITWYTIHMIGRGAYVTIPCYNDNFCIDSIDQSAPEKIYINDPIYIMPDEPTNEP